ncbi:dTMP kinase [candidate division KSB1 bacterium]|nr:MAG: dTMP kinase [candidate division KSB1 bacterium]
MNNKRFISFEGLYYSGKSTQIKLLTDYLEGQGQRVYAMREPGGTAISEKIREILLDKNNMNMTDRCEIFLYSAARVQLVQERIIPLLDKGYFVIADRYVDSTTAYQGYGRQLDLNMVQSINQAATFGLLPGKTFYLRLLPEQVYLRSPQSGRDLDRLEAAGLEFYRRVFQGYEKIVENNPQRFVVIDANLSIEQIHQRIVEVVKKTALGNS